MRVPHKIGYGEARLQHAVLLALYEHSIIDSRQRKEGNGWSRRFSGGWSCHLVSAGQPLRVRMLR